MEFNELGWVAGAKWRSAPTFLHVSHYRASILYLSMRRAILGIVVLLTLVSATSTVTEDQVRGIITPLTGVDRAGIDTLKAMGPEVLPHLARIYAKSSEDDRAVLAWIMYSIGQGSDMGSHLHLTAATLRSAPEILRATPSMEAPSGRGYPTSNRHKPF